MSETDAKLSLLERALHEIVAGDREAARGTLSHLVNERLDLSTSAADLPYFIFAAALSKRVGEEAMEEVNLYLRDYDVAQIRLFNLLATKVPTVSLTSPITNSLLELFMRGREQVSLIDVGIGTGRQEVNLLRALARRKALPRKLTVVGIEPSGDSLAEAEWTVLATALELGVDVEFRPIQKLAEDFTDAEWAALKELPGEIVINEAFAVHHILPREGSVDLRDHVFKKLCELNPVAFVLAEPSSDHHHEDLATRFRNSWHHFGLTFKLIDELEVEERDKNALKVCFFGREIEDILGNGERFRAERHEPVSAWLARLDRAGFGRASAFGPLGSFTHAAIKVRAHDGYVGLDYGDETLVAVMCAIPKLRMKQEAREEARSLRDVRHGFDPQIYLRALAAIALADGQLHERERAFIEEQARLFNVEVEPLWDQARDLTFLEGIFVNDRTRAAILRDAVLLARIDGEFHETERARLVEIASKLGLDEAAVAAAEQEAPRSMPPLIVQSKAPAWLADYWAISSKGKRGPSA